MPEAGEERTAEGVKSQRGVSRKEFGSPVLYREFETHVTNAQNAFLKGDKVLAEKEATLALRIRPTAHLFALLAVVAESKGQYDRASDFRLLQAFLARDVVLWEELLHEFLSEQLYYKSVVCLQRLSAMESKDAARFRTLQLQLADLLIGLGEIRRANDVLLALWNSSCCRDFDVFALLSSLYFQLGKWSSLQSLIVNSLRNTFHVEQHLSVTSLGMPPPEEANITASSPSSGGSKNPEAVKEMKRKRVSKHVRFFSTADAYNESGEVQTTKGLRLALAEGVESNATNEFDFDSLEQDRDHLGPSSARMPSSITPNARALSHKPSSVGFSNSFKVAASSNPLAQEASEVVRSLYGDRIELDTPAAKRNFLTLVNVHTELLNESGKFMETVWVMEFAAACLDVEILDLPPDLLVRLGTAYAFLEGMAQPCKEIFEFLMSTCAMDTYADVLLDAAGALQKTGMHTEAKHIFTSCARYYNESYRRVKAEFTRLAEEVAAAEAGGSDDHHRSNVASAERCQVLREQRDDVMAELQEVKTVLAAAYAGQAQSSFAMRLLREAEHEANMALEVEPEHLQSRLLLGRLYYYNKNDTESAVRVLSPRETDPALCRIQLGAMLVRIFFKSRQYVSAIALGVTIFTTILSSADDGDTQSIAPGSSRRSAAPLLMPTMSRATSAIIPSATLSGMLKGSASMGVSSATAHRLSASLAASIRSGTSLARQHLSRRSRSALTTTVYGASAAASIAAGWGREDEEAKLKDSSTIFRFNRKRRRGGSGAKPKAPDGTMDDQGCAEAIVEARREVEMANACRRKQRIEEVTKRDARSFWEQQQGEERSTDTDNAEDADKRGATADPMQDAKPVAVATDFSSVGASLDDAKGVGAKEDRRPPATVSLPHKASGGTTLGERDRDLAELEDLERFYVEEKIAAAGEVDMACYELPSLEEVSKQFSDPAMAEIFLKASTHEPSTGAAASASADDTAGDARGSGSAANLDRVTAREVIASLGRAELLALAVAIVDSYTALGRFSEAKEFASVTLTHFSQKRLFRQMGNPLERPLRLAVLRTALAAGESEDAFRVGFRLLREDTSTEEYNEVMELMHGVLARCEDRSAILYRAMAEGHCDAAHLVLLANRYYQTRSYTRVLNLYLVVLQERPCDIFLTFMVGLCYVLCSHQKRVSLREECVSAGVHYLSQYQRLLIALDRSRTGEALYNAARVFHYLRLYYLCVPLYERIVHHLCVPKECSLAIQRAARFNLYFIYRWGSGNRVLALAALQVIGE